MNAPAPMLPYTLDRDTGPFFEAARAHRLVYRVCNACGRGLHPPGSFCPYCGSADSAWRQARGSGTLHSWTTVAHTIHPGHPAPYTVVLVQLDDCADVRLVGRLDGAPALRAGMAMDVWFETVADGVVLPQWRPR